MEKSEILLLVNSVLLAIISIMFLVIGYFLKDLHKDFKTLIERVNKLYTDLYTHINLFDNISKLFQRQIDTIEKKVEVMEEKINKVNVSSSLNNSNSTVQNEQANNQNTTVQ